MMVFIQIPAKELHRVIPVQIVVVITNNITVRSVNGPENTIILGKGPRGSNAVRGVYMSSWSS